MSVKTLEPVIARKSPGATAERSWSIDVIRGAVMVLMAIDHVRVYAGVPAGGAEFAVFFTRWVTHFCAPAFIFLAGTSAYFYGRRYSDLPRLLFTRGLWLILLELTLLRLGWTFNLDFGEFNMAGVIWVIGWCMILMAPLVRLPAWIVALLGLGVTLGHNMIPALDGGIVWGVLYRPGPLDFGDGGPNLFVLYTIIPWIGVMAAGYGFGVVMTRERQDRDRLCLQIGLAAIAAFVVLRGFDLYGDPRPWRGIDDRAPLLAFLNTTKYPASLLFLLMTLGPTIAMIPLLERGRGLLLGAIAIFGRVPFFFYVLHIPLIHALAMAVSVLRSGAVDPWLFANHPVGPPPVPEGYAWSLALLYAVWMCAVALLWIPCRWFANLKARRSDRWLSYL